MASDICVELGKRIRELRKQRNWRQLDLATHARINENYVSELELGRKEPCLRMLATISGAMGVTLEELFRGIDR